MEASAAPPRNRERFVVRQSLTQKPRRLRYLKEQENISKFQIFFVQTHLLVNETSKIFFNMYFLICLFLSRLLPFNLLLNVGYIFSYI